MDVNKGDHGQPNYRSRLVATELEAGSRSLDHFAAMPRLEAKKAFFLPSGNKEALDISWDLSIYRRSTYTRL